ncbi:MAG: sulfide:quinone reductase [Gemmatimonadetes bacterium SCN 70-22]|nr:MAG: sulfide:quinone reductase [Gemmatimonadetes bacterium SCN 70-22]
MSRTVILGAGISGHTAATRLRQRLGRNHDVIVVTPNARWNWIPSNIWVGVGRMTSDDVTFPLAPVYAKLGITYVQARATELHPEGDAASPAAYVTVEHTSPERRGEVERIPYDFLVNATGPKLNFGAVQGLGPDGHSLSVCTASHATEAAKALALAIERMRRGERQTLVVGTSHGTCTCEGAAFEYVFNVEHEIRTRGLRHLADIVYLSNEHELGDFGVAGLHVEVGGFITHSKTWAESLYAERGIRWILQAHVERVEPGEVFYETLDGAHHSLKFDFAMLLPPFGGVGLRSFDQAGHDTTAELFAPNGFMRVDADYTQKTFDQWDAGDWPSTYQTPRYDNVFAVGIAFAPPHQISKPFKSPNGTVITPSPPRTGMPSGIMGRVVANTIADRILRGRDSKAHTASMARMGAACIASAGASLLKGTAAAMTMYPIVPDYKRFPVFGRDLRYTFGEIGLGAHWIKRILHHAFIWKAKARPGWQFIPE